MSSDTITLDYTITPTISTVDSGYVTTSSITGSHSNIWTDDMLAKSAITVNGTFEVQGRDVLAELDEMRDALMLIKRDVDMEAKYPKLKELKDEYAKQLAKYATFDAIKDAKLTYTDGDNT
jgi:hypothetical protein